MGATQTKDINQVIGEYRHTHGLTGNADQKTKCAEQPHNPAVEERNAANIEWPVGPDEECFHRLAILTCSSWIARQKTQAGFDNSQSR